MTSSPTPAVLPDARARLVSDLDRHASAIYKDYAQTDLWSALIAARDALATPPAPIAEGVTCVTKPLTDAERQSGIDQWITPPASDAAVPAGESVEQAFRKGWFTRGDYGTDRGDYQEMISTEWSAYKRLLALSAAPKVASDTGAGLRDAAQFLSDRLDELEWMDDDLEATCRDYMGHVDPAHDRLKSALASTDATDGATGGGEDIVERARASLFKLEVFAEGDDLRRVRDAIRAINYLATTPGGDLLEQADFRRYRAALQDIAGAEPIPNDAVAFVWCRTVAQDAINLAGGKDPNRQPTVNDQKGMHWKMGPNGENLFRRTDEGGEWTEFINQPG